MSNLYLKSWLSRRFIVGCSMFLAGQEAFASSMGSLPFNSTMNTLKDAISGPFILSASIIMIVITCLMLAFGEMGEGFKKIINIVLWLSIAFGSGSFVSTLFGGGAVF